MKPKVGWSPVRMLAKMLSEGKPTLAEIFAMAKDFGFDTVELHHAMIPAYDRRALDEVANLLQRYQIRLSMLTCAPDFTHPDENERERQLDEMKTKVVAAWVLGAEGVRVTVGCSHEGVSREEGINWAVEMLKRLAEFAHPRGVKLGLENHYKDRLWQLTDFAFDPDVFLEVAERLKGTNVGINFDCANPLMVNRDPIPILKAVADRVWHVHVSDRKFGEYDHRVLGDGDVPFEAFFAELAQIGFAGVISLEDGQAYAGDEGTRRSLDFLRQQIAKHWS
ncbi:MAG: sugar phosphate isomerase/epimerase family protein [Armatimonadota bacterium]|nr:sugar phosphate isomerase/epimerase family protein [Armatimonadota bacterium]